jgi:hypothetical protein
MSSSGPIDESLNEKLLTAERWTNVSGRTIMLNGFQGTALVREPLTRIDRVGRHYGDHYGSALTSDRGDNSPCAQQVMQC